MLDDLKLDTGISPGGLLKWTDVMVLSQHIITSWVQLIPEQVPVMPVVMYRSNP